MKTKVLVPMSGIKQQGRESLELEPNKEYLLLLKSE